MQFSDLTSIMHISATWAHIFLSLAAAILLFIKHHMPQERSQWYIVTFFSISSIAAFIEVFIILATQRTLDNVHLFEPRLVLTGSCTLSFLTIYYLELLRPQWLTIKRYFLIFSPGVLAIVITLFYFFQGKITHIHNIAEWQATWTNIDVLARFVLAILPLLYTFWLMSLCMRGHAGYRCPRIMMRGTMLISAALCITFFLSRGMNFFVAYMLHEGIFIALGVLIIYVEHYERLHIPLEKVRKYYTEEAQPSTHTTTSLIAQKLHKLMQDPTVWQDPELTGEKLAHMAATNPTYIRQAAKELGFASLSEMIHRRRIDYVCQRLRQEPNAAIQELFFDAGYRSRNTAWRHFTNIVGYSPSDFVKRNTPPPRITINNWFTAIYKHLTHKIRRLQLNNKQCTFPI